MNTNTVTSNLAYHVTFSARTCTECRQVAALARRFPGGWTPMADGTIAASRYDSNDVAGVELADSGRSGLTFGDMMREQVSFREWTQRRTARKQLGTRPADARAHLADAIAGSRQPLCRCGAPATRIGVNAVASCLDCACPGHSFPLAP